MVGPLIFNLSMQLWLEFHLTAHDHLTSRTEITNNHPNIRTQVKEMATFSSAAPQIWNYHYQSLTITRLLQTSPQNSLLCLAITLSPPSDSPHLCFNFFLNLVRYLIYITFSMWSNLPILGLLRVKNQRQLST